MKHKDPGSIAGYGRRNSYLAAMGFPSYRDYLNSPLWGSIRVAVIQRDGGKCRLCRQRTGLVHHLQYDRRTLAGTRLRFLVLLCDGCHRGIEFDGKRKLSCEDAYKRLRKALKGARTGKALTPPC